MSKKAKSLWIAIALWAAVVGCFFLVQSIYWHTSVERQTRILVPKGFRGYLVLKWGVSNAPPRPVVNGDYELRFPKTGHLATSDKVGNRQWPQPVSYFYDGTSLAPLKYNEEDSDQSGKDSCSASEVCLRTDGFYGDTDEVYFVGTGTEQSTTNARPQL